MSAKYTIVAVFVGVIAQPMADESLEEFVGRHKAADQFLGSRDAFVHAKRSTERHRIVQRQRALHEIHGLNRNRQRFQRFQIFRE